MISLSPPLSTVNVEFARFEAEFGLCSSGCGVLARDKASAVKACSTRVRLTRPGGRHLPGLSVID
ncbi:GM19286 [Drosophila sechellia]|uniref:GM19286 n=1 Tax=Drosophila sechellia TaxID=7238 RepID=B4IP69_DROSE|nr:GM19286 [Drosophila sechellia]